MHRLVRYVLTTYKLPICNTKVEIEANFVEINPEANGLFFFSGWFLSLSRSNISFVKYTPPDTKQKRVNIIRALISTSGENRTPEKREVDPMFWTDFIDS